MIDIQTDPPLFLYFDKVIHGSGTMSYWTVHLAEMPVGREKPKLHYRLQDGIFKPMPTVNTDQYCIDRFGTKPAARNAVHAALYNQRLELTRNGIQVTRGLDRLMVAEALQLAREN